MSTLKTNAIRNANASSDGVTLSSDGTIAVPNELTLSSNKHVVLPSGTTAQRAGSPPNYSLRYNTTLGELEFWDGANWNTINQTKAWDVDNTATHWWKSEGIASKTSWVAEVGGADFGAGHTDHLTYNATDSGFNNQKTIDFNQGADSNFGMLQTASADYWGGADMAWSVIMVIEKTDHNSGTGLGDGMFVQVYNNTTDGSWSVDLAGDHTWSNSYGEQVGGISGYNQNSNFPKKGIFCFRMNANGTNSEYKWQESGQSTFTNIATASSAPSSLPTNNYTRLAIGNFFNTTSSNHEWSGTIAEIAYYKDIRVTDAELARFSSYAKTKFGI